jgi:hypothetical protein
VRTLTTYT